jgi:hypothetical protein
MRRRTFIAGVLAASSRTAARALERARIASCTAATQIAHRSISCSRHCPTLAMKTAAPQRLRYLAEKETLLVSTPS